MCNPGHVKDLLNNCQPCGENQIPVDGKCVACPAGQIRAEDKTSCQSMFILETHDENLLLGLKVWPNSNVY